MRLPADARLAVPLVVATAVAVAAGVTLAVGATNHVDSDGHAAGEAWSASGYASDEHTGAGIAPALAQDIDADAVVLAADIGADGDADWRVTYRLTLDTGEREAAFADLREAVENDSAAYLDPFEARMTETATTASEATDREMAVRSFTVETARESQPQAAFGLVTFRFEWGGFAAVGSDTLQAGDALDGLVLGEGERLQFTWPAAYGRSSSRPEPDTVESGRVVWRGPLEFDTGQPRIELEEGGGSGSSTVLVVVAGSLVVLLSALAVWRWRARTGEGTGDSDAGTPAGAADSSGAATGGSTSVDDTGDGEEPPPELLSNEERVLKLIEQNGGRMKQQAVIEQLGWSDAKTSQVVADLRKEDAVESFRIGRQNVLTLPDVAVLDSTDDLRGSGEDTENRGADGRERRDG